MPNATDRRTDATLTDADGRTEPKAKPKTRSKTEPKTRPAARGTGKGKKKPAPKSRERAAARKKTPSAGPERETETRPAARKKEKKSRRAAVKRKAADRRRAFLLKRAERKSGKKRRRKGRKGLPILWIIILVLALWVLVGAVMCIAPAVLDRLHRPKEVPDWVDTQIIEVNGHARRGVPLDGVHDIVIHYVGNPGTSAQENHDFFAQPDTRVSAHFLVGLEGEIIQCIPLDEKSSASNNRNHDTISIEVCHPGRDGSFNDSTYWSLVKLTVWLCDVYRLSPDHVIRHYDVTGKKCPLYYVDHPEAWERFIEDVTYALDH